MNRVLGKVGAAITGVAVLSFAISLILGLADNPASLFMGCFSSIFIAIGFVLFMVSLYSANCDNQKKALGISGIAFAVVYAVLIFIVYYAECTTIRLNPDLSSEALSIISYGHAGSLFFNYDLLGYSFMALSTFLIGFTVEVKDARDKALKWLLWIHGIFFPACLIMPMFPLFTSGTSDMIGIVILLFWCVYFLPICVLGYLHFCKDKKSEYR